MSGGNKSLSVRLPQEAHDQIADLVRALNVPKASVVAFAVARMHHQEAALLKKNGSGRRKKSRGDDHPSV